MSLRLDHHSVGRHTNHSRYAIESLPQSSEHWAADESEKQLRLIGTMNVIIRIARTEDAEAIHRAHMKSIREICVKDHGKEEIKGWGFRIYDPSHRIETIKRDSVWVVEAEGQIEGFAHIRLFERDEAKQAYLWALYLTPKIVGKGFGLKLAQLMIESARIFGAERISLHSSLTAHKFYEKLGFKDDGPLRTIEINGHSVRTYCMELDLKT
jgi:putative acetyltransferase